VKIASGLSLIATQASSLPMPNVAAVLAFYRLLDAWTLAVTNGRILMSQERRLQLRNLRRQNSLRLPQEAIRPGNLSYDSQR
jgi:hypothetical protein